MLKYPDKLFDFLKSEANLEYANNVLNVDTQINESMVSFKSIKQDYA